MKLKHIPKLVSKLRINFSKSPSWCIFFFPAAGQQHVFVIFLPKKGFHMALLSHLFNFPYRYVKFFFQLQTPLISAMTHVFFRFWHIHEKNRESYRMESNLALVDLRLATQRQIIVMLYLQSRNSSHLINNCIHM